MRQIPDEMLSNIGGNRAYTACDAQSRDMVGSVYESIMALDRTSED